LGYFAKKNQIASSFFFLGGIEPFWGRQFTTNPSTKVVLAFLI